jgi:hypothetical protein
MQAFIATNRNRNQTLTSLSRSLTRLVSARGHRPFEFRATDSFQWSFTMTTPIFDRRPATEREKYFEQSGLALKNRLFVLWLLQQAVFVFFIAFGVWAMLR